MPKPTSFGRAARHATRSMRPHLVFLAYRVAIFAPTIAAIMPADHVILLVDACLVELSGITVVWIRRVRRAMRHGEVEEA